MIQYDRGSRDEDYFKKAVEVDVKTEKSDESENDYLYASYDENDDVTIARLTCFQILKF